MTKEVPTPLSARIVDRVGSAVTRVLKVPATSEVTLAFVGDASIKKLNAWTRKQNRPTDVLSFPLHERRPYRPDADGVVHLGDVVISVPTARRQAKFRLAPLRDELVELLIHGLLHLVGFDHETPRGAKRMARTAESILRHVSP